MFWRFSPQFCFVCVTHVHMRPCGCVKHLWFKWITKYPGCQTQLALPWIQIVMCFGFARTKAHTPRNSQALMSHFTRQHGDWHHGTYLNSQKHVYPFIEPADQLPRLSLRKETPLGEVIRKASAPAVNQTPFQTSTAHFSLNPHERGIWHLPRQGDQI